jgi:hypothetical protein
MRCPTKPAITGEVLDPDGVQVPARAGTGDADGQIADRELVLVKAGEGG